MFIFTACNVKNFRQNLGIVKYKFITFIAETVFDK